MTIALSNYCLKRNGLSDGKWRATVTYGTGKAYKLQEVNGNQQRKIRNFIERNFDDGAEFVEKALNGFSEKIAHGKDLQDMYEKNYSSDKLHPIDLVDKVQQLVSKYANGEMVDTKNIFKYKDRAHKRQLYALYLINHIRQIANTRR